VPLPELTQRLVEEKLAAYCERKVPPHVRDQLRLSFKIRGNNVTLNEERIAFSQPGTWVTIPLAQFRFDPKTAEWSLYCADRNGRWHVYSQSTTSRDLDAVIRALDTDRTGIFWG